VIDLSHRICGLPVGVVVTIGKTQGRVVRRIEDGFPIEFMQLRKFCPRIFRR
jgi:hypothetical protein